MPAEDHERPTGTRYAHRAANIRGGSTIDRKLTVDEALQELTEVTSLLETTSAGAPERPRLIARRDELRIAARLAADAARDPEALRRERNHLAERLQLLDEERIAPSRSERSRYRWIDDPGAYAANINRGIDGKNVGDRAEIEQRIAEIDVALREPRSERPQQA